GFRQDQDARVPLRDHFGYYGQHHRHRDPRAESRDGGRGGAPGRASRDAAPPWPSDERGEVPAHYRDLGPNEGRDYAGDVEQPRSVQPGFHDGQLGGARKQGPALAARGHAGTRQRPDGPHYRDPHQGQLPRGAYGARVLHLDPQY